MSPFVCRAMLITLLLTPFLAAQSPDPPSSTTTCNLDDGRQIYIRYNPVASSKEKIANGKPWTPGGAPMTLFTEAQLRLGTSMIPIGAYTVYPIPGKDHWTLAINKNVSAGLLGGTAQHLDRILRVDLKTLESLNAQLEGDLLALAIVEILPSHPWEYVTQRKAAMR